MATVRPFKGLLYSHDKTGGGYSTVVAPPYDVIPEGMRDELYEKSAFNVIRLILGRSRTGDDEKNNKYTRAKAFLDEWQKKKVLVRDAAETFYVYLQEYKYRGKMLRRIGFIGLIKIEDPQEGVVLPHEHTLAKPKEDRMNLIKQVRGNLSPIFTIFDDADGKVTGILERAVKDSDPVIDIELEDGRHAIWRITDKGSIGGIVSGMEGKRVFIADGHHRYEVARTYREALKNEEGYDGSADYVMMYFADMAARDNLTVMPTHRAIKNMPVSGDDQIKERLAGYFDITECGTLAELLERLEAEETSGHAFGYFGGDKYLFLKARSKEALLGLIAEERSEDWKLLDVSVLHAAVFGKLLCVKAEEGNITYVKEPEEAQALVKDGSHAAAFFLNSTRMDQLRRVAEKGEMMPQKSTYFYPKLLSGLVINRFSG